MKLITSLALAGALLAATSVGALAQERLIDGALGAGAGAVVGGPVGAVAGGAIGYGAGPRISRGMGVRGSRYRDRRGYRRDRRYYR